MSRPYVFSFVSSFSSSSKDISHSIQKMVIKDDDKKENIKPSDPLAVLDGVCLAVSNLSFSLSQYAIPNDAHYFILSHIETLLSRYHHHLCVSQVQHYHITRPSKAHSIRIIHNTTLLQRYEYARTEMIRQGIQFVERIKFHGTTAEAREAICQHGFQHRHSTVPGIWLAESSIAIAHQSNKYFNRFKTSTPDTQLLVCRVLVPQVYLRRPTAVSFLYSVGNALSTDEQQTYARLNEDVNGPIVTLTHTDCALPCAIIGY